MKNNSIKKYINEAGVITPTPGMFSRAAIYGAAKGVQKASEKSKEVSDQYGGYRYVKFLVKDKINEIKAEYNYKIDQCSTIDNDLDMIRCIIAEINNTITGLRSSMSNCAESEEPASCKEQLYEEIIAFHHERDNLMRKIRKIQQEEIRLRNSMYYDDTNYGIPMERRV